MVKLLNSFGGTAMGLFDRIKKKMDLHVYVVWHRKLDTPVFDTQRQLRVYTNRKFFESDYKKNNTVYWAIPYEMMELKPIEDVQRFYNTMWIHYGCKAAVVDGKESESLREKVSIDFSHFDKSMPHHEVCNPELRMCIVLFNMLSGRDLLKQKLLEEYLTLFNSAELLIPFNPQASSLIYSMNIGGSKKLIAYTSSEAVSSDLRNKGYTAVIVQKIDDLIETAIKENIEIAINVNSKGGGILLTYEDLFRINGTLDMFNKAEQFRIAQEIDKAAPLYEQAANAGYNVAQHNLAVLFQNGTPSRPADIDKAICWYEKASDTFAPSAFALGRIYDVGEVVLQDLPKAFRYYLKAANLEHSQAMYNLGAMYLYGDGVEKSVEQGIAWLQKAAQKGEPNAIAVLKRLLIKPE